MIRHLRTCWLSQPAGRRYRRMSARPDASRCRTVGQVAGSTRFSGFHNASIPVAGNKRAGVRSDRNGTTGSWSRLIRLAVWFMSRRHRSTAQRLADLVVPDQDTHSHKGCAPGRRQRPGRDRRWKSRAAGASSPVRRRPSPMLLKLSIILSPTISMSEHSGAEDGPLRWYIRPSAIVFRR